MARRPPGQPGKLVCWFRNVLFGRNLNEFPWYNKVDSMSSRFVEKPNIPVVNKIENNYYFQRDLRRRVEPPMVTSSRALLEEARENVTSEEVAFPPLTTPPVPGTGYRWKQD